jgi:hypothetical protein
MEKSIRVWAAFTESLGIKVFQHRSKTTFKWGLPVFGNFKADESQHNDTE